MEEFLAHLSQGSISALRDQVLPDNGQSVEVDIAGQAGQVKANLLSHQTVAAKVSSSSLIQGHRDLERNIFFFIKILTIRF